MGNGDSIERVSVQRQKRMPLSVGMFHFGTTCLPQFSRASASPTGARFRNNGECRFRKILQDEDCKMKMWLQKSAWIQPRASHYKVCCPVSPSVALGAALQDIRHLSTGSISSISWTSWTNPTDVSSCTRSSPLLFCLSQDGAVPAKNTVMVPSQKITRYS